MVAVRPQQTTCATRSPCACPGREHRSGRRTTPRRQPLQEIGHAIDMTACGGYAGTGRSSGLCRNSARSAANGVAHQVEPRLPADRQREEIRSGGQKPFERVEIASRRGCVGATSHQRSPLPVPAPDARTERACQEFPGPRGQQKEGRRRIPVAHSQQRAERRRQDVPRAAFLGPPDGETVLRQVLQKDRDVELARDHEDPSTPTCPPENAENPAWNWMTGTTATALGPSISRLYFMGDHAFHSHRSHGHERRRDRHLRGE